MHQGPSRHPGSQPGADVEPLDQVLDLVHRQPSATDVDEEGSGGVVEVVALEAGPAGGQVCLQHLLETALDGDGPGLAPLARNLQAASSGGALERGHATKKSKNRDHDEWARSTEAAAWSVAQEAKAARRTSLVRCSRCSTASSPSAAMRRDVVELQTLLGHASLDTTRRYLDATAEGLREVVRGHPGQVALRDHLRGSKS